MKQTNIIILIGVVIIAAILLITYKKQAVAPIDTNSTNTTTPTTTVPTTTVPAGTGIPGISYSGENAASMIRITSPKVGDQISSPLVITGEAKGPWYFEASFPIFLTDGDGLIIAEGHAEAQGDWMTENFVPFKATLTFTKPANAAAFGNRATLILKNDNPSGDPIRDKSAEIPVRFK